MLAQQAPRFEPSSREVESEVMDSARESVHQRIKRALTESDYGYPYFVRPLCVIATLAAKPLAEAETIQVPCPKDEMRNLGLPSGLRTANPNRISIYPMTEDAYAKFAANMERIGRDMGEYELFTRAADGGWRMEEFPRNL